MLGSISTTSILCHSPINSTSCLDELHKRLRFGRSQILKHESASRQCVPLIRTKNQPVNRFRTSSIRALAMEVTKEAFSSRKEGMLADGLTYSSYTVRKRSGAWPPRNKADDPKLQNPLLRLERMGCGWLGAIFEWEGVIVEDSTELEKQSWLILSQEEGKSPPPAFVLRRIEGMKNEQAISEVLCWSRDPIKLRRLGSRREEIYQSLLGGYHRLQSGSQEFMTTLINYKIPTALVSTRSRKNLEAAIELLGLEGHFNGIVAAEDVYRGKPDPEMFVYAAQLLNFIPERCIVFGNSNSAVEAAHEAQMKCVAVASKHRMYELGAADLVVHRLDELSIVDLKNLADIDSPEFNSSELELQVEEEENSSPSTAIGLEDKFW